MTRSAMVIRPTNPSQQAEEEAVRIINYDATTQDTQAKPSTRQVLSTAFGQSITITVPAEAINPLKKISLTIIRTQLLIPGDGEPIPDAALVIENKLIAWLGRNTDIPSKYTSAPHKAISTPYLMPGLWECHSHFMGDGPEETSYAAFVTSSPITSGARLTRSCWEALQRGYTSVRDLAGLGPEIAAAVNDGSIVGPNIYSAGACLSQTAGHGDAFSLPPGVVLTHLGVNNHNERFVGGNASVLADGVDECRRATRLQIRRGAKCIKILASGGVLSRDDDVSCAQFSQEELDVIVSEATRQKRCVAAHVHAKSAILAAVQAGVRSVEHVSFADEECIKLIKEKDVIYVATRWVVQMLLDTHGKGIDPSSWEKAKLAASNHLKAYKLAIQHACTFALGSDSPPGDEASAIEIQYAVEAGMSNIEALKAATANGPLTVAGQAPKTGQLKVGYEADILGLTENPVKDVKVLQNKDNIRWVWKGGKLYKGPGIGPWGE